MACCRGKRRSRVPTKNEAAPCTILEQGGASLKLWPANVDGRYQLLVYDSEAKGHVDVQALIYRYNCSGPVATMIRSQVERVMQAISRNPAPFIQHGSAGTSLVNLLRTADTVLGGSQRHGRRRVHPFTRR